MTGINETAREAVEAFLRADHYRFADLRETLTDRIGEAATAHLLRETLAEAA